MNATFTLLLAEPPDLPMANDGNTVLAARVPLAVVRKVLRFMTCVSARDLLFGGLNKEADVQPIKVFP